MNNETRFWLLGSKPSASNLEAVDYKATLFVDLPENRPGALYQVLAVFAQKQLNLTKIESRPQKTQLGEYFFVVDVAVKAQAKELQEAISLLQEQQFPVHLIGQYPVYKINQVKPAQ